METKEKHYATIPCLGQSLGAVCCYFKPTIALWSRTAKNTACSTGPLACLSARSLAPLTSSLAQHYSLCLRAPLCSLVCSLAHFAHSRTHGTANDWIAICSVFFSILAHRALPSLKSRNHM